MSYTAHMELPELERLPGVPLPLLRGEPHDCPYLAQRTVSELYALPVELIDAELYGLLLDHGFRRAGRMFYRPDCPACRACEPIRVPVEGFRPSGSQRRVLRRNRDVRIELGRPHDDDERYHLFRRHQDFQHEGRMCATREDYVGFLIDSPIETLEMTYWLGAGLVGVGVVDVLADALSSVYFAFEPDYARRSLGVFSGLCEIDECRRRGLAYWYVGFCVRGCAQMEYKARYRPHELLIGGLWRAGGKRGCA